MPFPYSTIPGDPLQTRIYILENGLTVYLSVYKDSPRIQTFIAVRAGSRNDPPETTGLAHYFEHMMFKGTEHYGTTDWSREKPLIENIEDLFEKYRQEEDEELRASIYREIDTLSFRASHIAISNEYDKLMDAIGSQGSNAATSNDYTIYMENIPANQLENWAWIEADRFTAPVLRLFHTEVETVFEEKNRSLTNDIRKVSETMLRLLFPDHPYGRQTTLGDAKHLKNPSMRNLRKFFSEYYVPNNMALCLSGDLDPDKTIDIIGRHFGKMLPGSPHTPVKTGWTSPERPVIETVRGLEAESVRVAYGFDIPASSDRALLLRMISAILYNGKAGLIDLNLLQPQKVLSAYGFAGIMNDCSYLAISGKPGPGQSLEEVKDLLLKQAELLKNGEFPDWMVEAAVNNYRLDRLRQFENNQGRALAMSNAFLSHTSWEKSVSMIEDMARITREEITRFARENMGDGYVVVYKEQGFPDTEESIAKPPITPVHINYTDESAFLREVKSTKVVPVEPKFIDYSRDISRIDLPSGIRILANPDMKSELFTFTRYFRIGKSNDKVMHFALQLLPFLGTSRLSAEQVRQEFYRIACDFDIIARDEDTAVTISGLASSFPKAFSLMQEVLEDCVADDTVLETFAENFIKSRNDLKQNQQEVFNALVNWGVYGSLSPYADVLSDSQVRAFKAEELVSAIHSLCGYRHDVLYFGPSGAEEIAEITGRGVNKDLIPPHESTVPVELPTDRNRVYFIHYDARQARLQTIIRAGRYDPRSLPLATLYDFYMANLSFQELRERRALAYTAWSRFMTAPDLERYNQAIGFIGTQGDKMIEALDALNELYDSIPLTPAGLDAAQNGVIGRIRTERISRMGILWNFLEAERHGLDHDIREQIFRNIPGMDLDDILAFNEEHYKNKPKTYLVLGREPDLDMAGLSKFGIVEVLTPGQVFGF